MNDVAPEAALAPSQTQVRLSDTHRAELVQRHQDGAFKMELATAYEIHVETVRAITRRCEDQRHS